MLSDPTVIDLECAAIADIEKYYDDSEPIEAPANYKDPEKIAAYIKDATVRRKQAFIDRSALDPDLCRIVMLGVWPPHYDHPSILECVDEAGETFALQMFWDMYHAGEVLCGFNIRSYDLPVIYRRSLYLGVPTKVIERDRYRSTQVIDLFEQLNEGRKHQMHSLDWYHRRLGCPPVADTITGADVPGCVARGEWDAVRAHLLGDLVRVRDVARRMGILAAEGARHEVSV
jgi:predicted 3'-5' exonuclease similar to PolB exonuclease domain